MAIAPQAQDLSPREFVYKLWGKNVRNLTYNAMLWRRWEIPELSNKSQDISGIPTTWVVTSESLHGLDQQLLKNVGIYKSWGHY